jgi:hypothetical protein
MLFLLQLHQDPGEGGFADAAGGGAVRLFS